MGRERKNFLRLDPDALYGPPRRFYRHMRKNYALDLLAVEEARKTYCAHSSSAARRSFR
jgi:hypothetical protein